MELTLFLSPSFCFCRLLGVFSQEAETREETASRLHHEHIHLSFVLFKALSHNVRDGVGGHFVPLTVGLLNIAVLVTLVHVFGLVEIQVHVSAMEPGKHFTNLVDQLDTHGSKQVASELR